LGPFQYIILIAAGLCFAADAMEIVLLSFLSVVLQEEWHLTPNETAFITSVLFFGASFGTLVLGPLADRWGRRPVFLCTAWIISIASLISAFMSHYTGLLVIIFIIGFGIGGLTVPFDILAEFLPSARRGSNLLMIEYCWTLGVLLVVWMAQHTLSQQHTNDATGTTTTSENNWRALVLGCASVCCISALLGTCLVPESPRWLVTQGRNQEAIKILQRAAIWNGLVDVRALDMNDNNIHLQHDPQPDDNTVNDVIFHPLHVLFLPHVQLMDSETDMTTHKKSSFADLFQPRWRRTTLFLWGTWAAFAFGYYGSIQTMTRVFEMDHHNDTNITNTTTLLSIVSHNTTSNTTITNSSSVQFDYQALWISSSAEFVGTTLAVFSVDRVGRIPFQMVSYATAGVAICLLCVVSQNPTLPSVFGSWVSSSSFDYRRWTLIGLGFITRVFEMSATCVTWVMTAEILTTEVRTTGKFSCMIRECFDSCGGNLVFVLL
jgi:MFS family permease